MFVCPVSTSVPSFTVISYRVNNVHWTCNNLLNSAALVQIIDIQKVTVYIDSVYNLYYSKIECTIWILIFWSVCLRFISAWSDRLDIFWEIRRNSSYSVILNLLSKFCNNFFRLLLIISVLYRNAVFVWMHWNSIHWMNNLFKNVQTKSISILIHGNISLRQHK